MSGVTQLVLIIGGMHVLVLVCVVVLLIPALKDQPVQPRRPSDDGSDDGWGHGPPRPPAPPQIPTGGIPLPDAIPARVRLRDHDRLGDHIPRPERRPSREPQPDPGPVRAKS